MRKFGDHEYAPTAVNNLGFCRFDSIRSFGAENVRRFKKVISERCESSRVNTSIDAGEPSEIYVYTFKEIFSIGFCGFRKVSIYYNFDRYSICF